MKYNLYTYNISPHKWHKNTPYTPHLFKNAGMYGYTCWIHGIRWILNILAFIAYSFNYSANPVSRDTQHQFRLKGRKEFTECLNIILASTWRERKALMTAKTSGHEPLNARDNIYTNALNAPAINECYRASKERMTVQEYITLEGLEAVGVQWINGVQVILGNYNRLRLTDNTRKILDILRIELTKKAPYSDIITEADIVRVRSVTLELKTFMELCGIKDKKHAMEELRANAYTLFNLSMIWDEEGFEINPRTGRKKRKKIHWDTRLFDSTKEVRNLDSDPVINSSVTFNFAYDLVRYLCQKYIMGYCKKALTINTHKHPHALCMAHKLMEHYNMNVIKTDNVRITVGALMAACPELPTFEEVKNRHHTQLIREPFERDLLALRDIYGIINWKYCNAGGEPLADEQQADFSFKDWEQWRIEYTLPDYPDQTERNAEAIRRAAAAKRRRTKSAKPIAL